MTGRSMIHAIEASSPEAITEQIRAFDWNSDYDQIQAGTFRGRVTLARIGTIQVASLSYSAQILSRGTPPAGCITLGIVGHVRGRARWRGHEVTPNLVFVADPATEIDLLMGEEFELWLMVIPESLLDRGRTPRARIDSLRIQPELRHRLISHVRRGLHDAARAAKDGMTLEAVSLYEARSVALARRTFLAEPGWSPTPPLALKLENLLRTHSGAPLPVPQLAAHLSTSDRTLRRACRKAFGCSPSQLARTLRLNAAHRDLRLATANATRVWEVAARHGFWHMGQFGQDFHRLFGERPSETLSCRGTEVGTGEEVPSS